MVDILMVAVAVVGSTIPYLIIKVKRTEKELETYKAVMEEWCESVDDFMDGFYIDLELEDKK